MQQRQQANPVSEPADPAALVVVDEERPRYRWYDKLAAVMAAIFCFEVGVFLLVYPWVSNWDVNGAFFPVWARPIWTSSWLRGAVSGIGILDIYISFVEVFRFRRFSS